VNTSTAVALVLAFASTVLINLAYLREHDAAAALPVLGIRRPLQSARALLTDRSWLLGFTMVTVAGLATLLRKAVPIAAGTIVLDEPVPSGAYGALRILAFAAVTIGAIFLARPEKSRSPEASVEG
jgi:hypothetical protein